MEYVSKVLLEVNGQSIDDFDTITEPEEEVRKAVKLMNKTGFVSVTPNLVVEVVYAIPKDAPTFDFKSVQDGTLTVDYENGTRRQYTGVSCLKLGKIQHDGEKHSTRAIELQATGVTE